MAPLPGSVVTALDVSVDSFTNNDYLQTPRSSCRWATTFVNSLFDEAGNVKAELGTPVFEPSNIPFIAENDSVEHTLALNNVTVTAGVVSMGNPHAVLRVDDAAATPVEKIGPMIQLLDDFPEGVNVGFMQIENSAAITLRVFERGAGETLACGSGACAAVVHGIRLGQLSNNVTVSVPGGKLEVSWDGSDGSVWLAGPAETVFEGKLTL